MSTTAETLRRTRDDNSWSPTFWMLYGMFGPAMTMEQIRNQYFPNLSMKTMQNKACSGLLPKRTGDVYDTRDVAEWWESLRAKSR